MSYSFTVRAATKAAAKEAVAAAFEEMVSVQPIHARDKDAALANAGAVIDLLTDDDPREIAVAVNGYLGWRDILLTDGSNPLLSASVSASATFV